MLCIWWSRSKHFQYGITKYNLHRKNKQFHRLKQKIIYVIINFLIFWSFFETNLANHISCHTTGSILSKTQTYILLVVMKNYRKKLVFCNRGWIDVIHFKLDPFDGYRRVSKHCFTDVMSSKQYIWCCMLSTTNS